MGGLQDEIIVLNATKKDKDIVEFSNTLKRIVEDVFIPVSAGGGVKSIKDAELLFNSGADKIVLNSILFNDINLVHKLIEKFGSQSIVASVDYINNEVFINNGIKKINRCLKDYIEDITSLGIGEIYLNSIDRDGTGFGYDFETINDVAKYIKTPLIIAGGAGNSQHLEQGLKLDCVSGVATANLFNFIGDGLSNARNTIISNDGNLAKW
jgi:cyclase